MPPQVTSNKRKEDENASGPDMQKKPRTDDGALHETDYLKMLEVKKAALLGYGIMSFANLNDMGRGLQLELKKFNPRAATPAQINALRTAVGGDAKDPAKDPTCLNRFSPEHAMFIVVKSRYLDLQSLRRDPFSSEFLQVRWLAGARKPTTTDVAHLVNGNTRRELCLTLGASAIAKLEGVQSKLAKVKGTGSEYQQLIKDRNEAMVQVRMKTSWIVAFFDQELIEKNIFCTEVIFELSKNQPTYQVPDSEAASLQLTINYVLSVPEEDRLLKIQKASSSDSHMLHGMQKRLQSVFRDTSLFMALVKLNPYSVLWSSRPLTVNVVFNWRTAAAPFMEAIILQGVLALDFLSSSQTLPRGGLPLDEAQHQMFKSSPKAVPHVFDAAFFEVLDKVYKTHLHEIRESFGLARSSHHDREAWSAAMDLYWRDLLQELQKWAHQRKTKLMSLRTMNATGRSQIETALDRMAVNLPWISRGLFNSTAFGMRFPTPAPLLSPMFLLGVSESITALKPWLELAWRWIDPYVTSSQAIQSSFGTTLSLVHAIDHQQPVIPSQQIVWALASEIFCMRADALFALCNADAKAKETPLPPRFSSLPLIESHKPTDLCDTISSALRAWRNGSPQEIIDAHGLLRRNFPEDAKFDLLKLPNGSVIINALSSTFFPWAACPSNQVSGRIGGVARLAVQLLWMSHHQERTYADIPAYCVLRAEMEKILSANTADFKDWWDGHVEGEPKMPPSPQDASTHVGEAKANQIHSGTQKAIQAIAKILCREDAGAIPVPVDADKSEYQPFEDVHDAAMLLFKALAVSSCRAQSVFSNPDQERLVFLSKKQQAECLALYEIPSSFKPAPFDVVEVHYEKKKLSVGRKKTDGAPVRAATLANFSSPPVKDSDELLFKVNMMQYGEDVQMVDEEEEE